MKNKFIWILIILAVLVGGFYLLNSYIYKEKQVNYVMGETVSKSGKVLSVNLDQAAFDGPYIFILESDGGEVSTIAVPSMGLPLCAAYQNKNIGDVYLIKVGEMIEVRGVVSEDGSIVPCESTDHYFRTKGVVAENFEGEADPNRMTLGMKTWNWESAQYNDGREVRPRAGKTFTLTFSADGKFSATTDCNSMGGSYSTTSVKGITFSNIFSTLMFCEGSQEAEFSTLLQNTDNYHFTSKGELILDLKFDSGSVVFK
jgi:heat shock protein HslJ